MTTDPATTILRDTEHAARHDAQSAPFAPVDTWPETWGDRPRGWSVYDEVPSLSELAP